METRLWRLGCRRPALTQRRLASLPRSRGGEFLGTRSAHFHVRWPLLLPLWQTMWNDKVDCLSQHANTQGQPVHRRYQTRYNNNMQRAILSCVHYTTLFFLFKSAIRQCTQSGDGSIFFFQVLIYWQHPPDHWLGVSGVDRGCPTQAPNIYWRWTLKKKNNIETQLCWHPNHGVLPVHLPNQGVCPWHPYTSRSLLQAPIHVKTLIPRKSENLQKET